MDCWKPIPATQGQFVQGQLLTCMSVFTTKTSVVCWPAPRPIKVQQTMHEGLFLEWVNCQLNYCDNCKFETDSKGGKQFNVEKNEFITIFTIVQSTKGPMTQIILNQVCIMNTLFDNFPLLLWICLCLIDRQTDRQTSLTSHQQWWYYLSGCSWAAACHQLPGALVLQSSQELALAVWTTAHQLQPWRGNVYGRSCAGRMLQMWWDPRKDMGVIVRRRATLYRINNNGMDFSRLSRHFILTL